MDRIKKITNEHKIASCFWGGAVWGMLFFFLIYGYRVLNVSYEAFIMNEGTDLPGFQIVWDAYRYAGFSNGNGIGLFNTLTYPNFTSLVLQDEVPLLAVILKLFSFMLPEHFQYVGLWGLLCFVFQGGISAVILRKFIPSNKWSVFFALPFIIATPVITKLFYHHAQAGQWVLLLAFCVWFYRVDAERKFLKECLIWLLMGVLTAGVNIYYLPMVGIIFVGYAVNLISIKWENIKVVLGMLVAYISGALIFIASLGGFSIPFNTDANFYDIYLDRLERCGANLNTFINSSGISYFFKALPVAKDGQGEGLAYLGAGMLIALVLMTSICVYQLLSKVHQCILARKTVVQSTNQKEEIDEKSVQKEKNTTYTNIGLLVMFILSIVVGMGPTISWGEDILWMVPYPDWLLKLWCNFRSTGRIIWPAYYGVYIIIFRKLFSEAKEKESTVKWTINKEIVTIFLVLCCIIQVIDLHPYLKGKRNQFMEYQKLDTTIKDDAWKYLGENYKHMVVLPNSLVNQSGERNYLAKVAIDYDLTMNDYYLARQSLADQSPYYKEEFAKKNFDVDTFYIIKYSEIEDYIQYDLNFYIIDEYVIGTVEDISDKINKNVIEPDVFYSNRGKNSIYEGRDYSPVFDPVFYYYKNDAFVDVPFDAEEVLKYFVNTGMEKGDVASIAFSPKLYAQNNKDIKKVNGKKWKKYYLHYLDYGLKEGRRIF